MKTSKFQPELVFVAGKIHAGQHASLKNVLDEKIMFHVRVIT